MKAPSVQAAIAQVLADARRVDAQLELRRLRERREGCFEDQVAAAAWATFVRRWPALRGDRAREAEFVARTAEWMHSIKRMPRPQLPARLEQLIEERNFAAALELACHVKGNPVDPGYRPWHQITLAIEMALTNPDVGDWPRLFSEFLEYADEPSRETRLRPILTLLHSLGLRVCDNDAAARAFDALPDSFQVFRGTVQAEADSRNYGLCWTLNRDVALLFARFQNYRSDQNSPAVLLHGRAKREDVLAIFLRRGHEELMLLPEKLQPIRMESLPQDNVKSRFDELTDEDRRAWRVGVPRSSVLP